MDTSAIMGFYESLMDVNQKRETRSPSGSFDKGGSDLRNDHFLLTKQIVTLPRSY
jgi:hypothetical protein